MSNNVMEQIHEEKDRIRFAIQKLQAEEARGSDRASAQITVLWGALHAVDRIEEALRRDYQEEADERRAEDRHDWRMGIGRGPRE